MGVKILPKLTYASILGKCSSTICFFGDSRQMPPIFRPELESNVLSKSILDYCENSVKSTPVCVLPETHRMNKDITSVVSKSFYEPHGITLRSAGNIAGNTFLSPFLDENGYIGSVVFADPDISSPDCQQAKLYRRVFLNMFRYIWKLLQFGNIVKHKIT